MTRSICAIVIVLLGFSGECACAQSVWGEFPANAKPHEMGKKIANNLIVRPNMEARNYGIIYPEICAGYGSIRFAGATNDKELLAKLIDRYDAMLEGWPATAPGTGQASNFLPLADAKAATMIPIANNVDHSVFGILPMEIFRQNGDKRYLEIGKKSADDQWATTIEGDLTNQTRWWIDDMFMITALQSQAYRVTKEKIYLDRAAREMVAYLKLQLPNGLFYHRENVQFIWGRGDGWMAAGMAELLSEMPADHPQHARIMEGYKKMMAGLLKNQSPEGMWRQLIDKEASWPETSGTGMFVFSMATGVRKGWLDSATYKEPVKKAWIALCGYVNEDGNVREVSIGTNANASNTEEFYLSRTRAVGDLHGQAGFIWAAYAMLDQ